MKLKDVIYEKVKSEIKQILNTLNKYISMSSRLKENRKLSQSIRKSLLKSSQNSRERFKK